MKRKITKLTCPRRMADWGPWEREEGLDGFEMRRSDRFLSCTFCGSMHPDDLLEAIREGQEIGPTDKSYKLYVDGMAGKFYTHHLSPEQGDEFIALWEQGKINWGYPGRPYVRLYIPGRPA